VLSQINKRYNLGILEPDFQMEQQLDTMGDHYVRATFRSEKFNKEFTFYVKINIKQKKAVEEGGKKQKTKA